MPKRRENLTQKKINHCQPKATEYELRDHIVTQLYYRVKPNNARSWVVKYTDPTTGQRRRKYTLDVPTNRLEDARAAAEAFFRTVAAGIDPRTERDTIARKSLTLAGAVELYKNHVSHLRTGKAVITELLALCRWNGIGNKAINNITRSDLAEFVSYQQSLGRKKRTINKKMTLLYGMMSKLYAEGILSQADVALPPKPKKLREDDSDKSRSYFEADERKRLIETAKTMQPAWLYPAVVISLHTGMRPGTLFRLRWSDIDWGSQTINLRAAIMKTKDDWIIPFNETVKRVLLPLRPADGADGYVLTQSDGMPIPTAPGNTCWGDVFRQLCREAGIKGKTWYNMRHDFASQLVMNGVDLYTVKDLMCHKDITTTQIYAHLSPNLKRRAVSVLDNL